MAESVIAFTHQNVRQVLDRLSFPPEDSFLLVETMEPEQTRLVLEKHTYVVFDYASAKYDVDHYASGRVFAATGELRWQTDADGLHLVYIGDDTKAAALRAFIAEPVADRALTDPVETSIFLWGQKIDPARVQTELGFAPTDNIFLELRIPQYLWYPVPAADRDRVQVRVREYYGPDGTFEYYRFMSVNTWKAKINAKYTDTPD